VGILVVEIQEVLAPQGIDVSANILQAELL
jgi:hypothetical protein